MKVITLQCLIAVGTASLMIITPREVGGVKQELLASECKPRTYPVNSTIKPVCFFLGIAVDAFQIQLKVARESLILSEML